MATILFASGKKKEITPLNGATFTLEELQNIVHGYIELVPLDNGQVMVVNEEGKLENLEINEDATVIFQQVRGALDFILGDVLICNKGQIL